MEATATETTHQYHPGEMMRFDCPAMLFIFVVVSASFGNAFSGMKTKPSAASAILTHVLYWIKCRARFYMMTCICCMLFEMEGASNGIFRCGVDICMLLSSCRQVCWLHGLTVWRDHLLYSAWLAWYLLRSGTGAFEYGFPTWIPTHSAFLITA